MDRLKSRRSLLTALGSSAVVGLAGCSGGTNTGTSNGTTNGTTAGTTTAGTTTNTTTGTGSASATVLEDFEDLSKWKAVQGSITGSGSTTYAGSQSMKVTAKKSTGIVWVRRGVDWDLTNKRPSMAIRIEKPVQKVVINLRLHAPNADNTVTVGQMVRVEPGQQWFRLDLGTRTIDGNPDLSKVTQVDLRMRGAGGATDEFYVDDLRALPAPKKGAVAFTFDDALTSQYEAAYPILKKHGVPATASTITGKVGTKGHLTLDQMNQMKDAGWEFASHTHTHVDLTSVGTQRMWTEILDAHDWLVNHGFKKGASSLVYPYGRWTHDVIDFAKKYHDSGYRYLSPYGSASSPITDPWTIARGDGTDPDVVKSMINFAQFYHDIAVFTFHSVGTGDNLSISKAELDDLVSYAKRRDVDVLTLSELKKKHTRKLE